MNPKIKFAIVVIAICCFLNRVIIETFLHFNFSEVIYSIYVGSSLCFYPLFWLLYCENLLLDLNGPTEKGLIPELAVLTFLLGLYIQITFFIFLITGCIDFIFRKKNL